MLTPSAPLNKPAAFMFAITLIPTFTVLPWYLWTQDTSAWLWFWAGVLLWTNGLSITAGYHRLWAHRAYEAAAPLKIFYLLFGAMALQNSILVWASMHRVHHKDVDDVDHDPYSIKRGFWYAHMGWMLRDYPSSQLDYKNAKDLMEDKYVMFQHRFYLPLVLLMNVGLPLLMGWAMGNVWGGLLLLGVLRLVLSHQFTFFINSLAHCWGRQPYTQDNTARDNDFLAFFTYGEGYHNYHHLFQWDYRNGIRWWQYDPTKWLIAVSSWVGLAKNLKRVPEFQIQKAMVQRQIERARERLEKGHQDQQERLQQLRVLFEQELQTFTDTLNRWKALQSQRFEAAKRDLNQQWQQSEMAKNLRQLEQQLADSLHQQRMRMQVLVAQAA
jgi:stearoyl-CoA desaturase (delta-9 desaturase)